MATAAIESRPNERRRRLSFPRLIAAGGATGAVVFVFCWIGTFIPFSSPTHAYITLFTSAEVSSGRALAEGALWSLLFGAFVTAVFALAYNLAGAVVRR
jgi:hypothetical protein